MTLGGKCEQDKTYRVLELDIFVCYCRGCNSSDFDNDVHYREKDSKVKPQTEVRVNTTAKREAPQEAPSLRALPAGLSSYCGGGVSPHTPAERGLTLYATATQEAAYITLVQFWLQQKAVVPLLRLNAAVMRLHTSGTERREERLNVSR